MYLIFKQEGAIGRILLNRPDKHNAFDDVLIEELLQTLKNIEQNPEIRVVILSATGPSFSAGADLQWMQKIAAYDKLANLNDAMKLAEVMCRLNQLSKPTIALVQGNAYGGALGLIACCDIALASPEAQFCFSEVKLGLIPAVISPYILAAIGERAARRYFLTSENFSAQTAVSIGLIHEITPNLEAQGLMLAEQILHNAPDALSRIKKLVGEIVSQPVHSEIIRKTAQAIADTRVSPEGQEGLKAFLEKRPPKWVIKS